MVPFENDNLRAYTLLLRIEIALRECLRLALESEFGSKWRTRLPGVLLTKIKESQTEENRPHFNFVRLGPLYYLTFPELLLLLQQKSGRVVTNRLGGDCFLKQYENIFTPRNAICHSRPVSSVGLKVIEALYVQMETGLTSKEMAHLLSKPDTGLSQGEAAQAIKVPLKQILRDLPNLPQAFPIPDVYQTATNQFWWADDSLSGFKRSSVETAINLIREYNALPAGVGCAGGSAEVLRATGSE